MSPRGVRLGTVIGAYRIMDFIDQGGMGIVYLAEHQILQRTVAFKVLSDDLADDESFRARFLRESRLAVRLSKHPNVVQVYDAGEIDNLLYIAMYFVDGTTLQELLRAEKRLAPERALAILAQVASALDAAHELGLVHRDVKPGNILIEAGPDGTDHCYLGDFGLVREISSRTRLTRTGFTLATLEYACPEQLEPDLLEGESIDGRADQYSLGCVLFECLTGAPPFGDRDTDVALVAAHLTSPPPVLTERRPDLPPALNVVVATAMAKARAERYATCGEFLRRAVEACSVAAPTAAEPPPTAEPPGATPLPPAPPVAVPSTEVAPVVAFPPAPSPKEPAAPRPAPETAAPEPEPVRAVASASLGAVMALAGGLALALSALVPWWSVVGESFLVSPLSPGLDHPGHTQVGVVLALLGLGLGAVGGLAAWPRRRVAGSKPFAAFTTSVGVVGATALVVALYGQVRGFREVSVHPFPLGFLVAVAGAAAVVVGAFRPLGRRTIPFPAALTLVSGVLVTVSAILPWWYERNAQTFAPLDSGYLQIGERDTSAHGTLIGIVLLLLGLALIVLAVRSIRAGGGPKPVRKLPVAAGGVAVLLDCILGAALGGRLVGLEVRILTTGFGLIAALIGAVMAIAAALVPGSAGGLLESEREVTA